MTPELLRETLMHMEDAPRGRAVLALYYLTGARRNELLAGPVWPSERDRTAPVGPRLRDVRIERYKDVEIMTIRLTTLKRVEHVGGQKLRHATRVVPVVLDPKYEPLGPMVKEYYLARVQRAQERAEYLRERIPKREWNSHPELTPGNYPLLARLVPSPWRHERPKREPYYVPLTVKEVRRLFTIIRRELGLPPGQHDNPLRHIRATHLVTYYGFTITDLSAFTGWKLPGMAEVYVHLGWKSYIELLLKPVAKDQNQNQG